MIQSLQLSSLASTSDDSLESGANLAANTLSSIDEIIRSRSVLTHPFYQAWQSGTLSSDALQDYAAQYYHHVAAFPTYLSALHSHIDDVATRQVILENLIDEEHGTDNHPELWLRFAEGIGCDRSEVLASQPLPQTQALITSFKSHTASGSVASGLAALYAYETQIPAVSVTKTDGLRRFYGISDPRTLSYFNVHAEADLKHSADERNLLARHISTETDAQNAIAASDAITESLWNLLSDIGGRHEIELG